MIEILKLTHMSKEQSLKHMKINNLELIERFTERSVILLQFLGITITGNG